MLEFLARNQGLITPREQEDLTRSRILIAGVGGVGGRVAETLVRMGFQDLTLADPDIFTITNLNRQAGSSREVLGRSKVSVISNVCRAINASAALTEVADGVTEENVDDLVAQCDVVVDGTDFTRPDIGLMIAESASRHTIPVVLGVEVGFGVWQSVIAPNSNGFRRLMGLPSRTTPAELRSGTVSIPLWRWVAMVPPYTDPAVLRSVAAGKVEAPAIAPAVELAAAVISTSVFRLVTGGQPIATAPRVHHIDVRTGRTTAFRPSRARFLLSTLRSGSTRF